MRTLGWKEVHGTLLIVHAQVDPDAEDWAGLMRAGAEMGSRMRRCLVISDVTLSARHRHEIADVTKAARTEAVAVVTSSAVGRMIVTGLGWVTGIHKGFDPHNLDAAFEFLKVTESDRRELLQAALAFADEFGHSALRSALENHPLMRRHSAA